MPTSTLRSPDSLASRHRQAAALAWRVRGGSVEVLLVTNAGGRRWILPKGNVEPGEPPWASAEREALEEAGLVGRAHPTPIGRYRTLKRGLSRQVDVFLLDVEALLERWIERGLRRRKWMALEVAVERVREPGLKALLARIGAEVGRHARRRRA